MLSWALVIVAAIVAALVVLSHHFHPFASHPSVLHVCGQDYEPSGSSTNRAQVQATSSYPFEQVTTAPGDVFGTAQVWGIEVPRLGAIPTGNPCGSTVWLRTGTDSFKPYNAVPH